MERHSDDKRYPFNAKRTLTAKERQEARGAELTGIKAYQLKVALLT